MTIPVIINNRNLLTWTKAMVERVKKYNNVGEVIIVDNVSTYEPLLEWYKTFPCEIVMKPNLGHTGAWLSGVVGSINSEYYIVTDPDLGLEDTPDDTLDFLKKKFEDNPGVGKIGLGLDWQCVSPSSPYYGHIQSYEKGRWENSSVIDKMFMGVAIDTTFALYPKGTSHFTGGASMSFPYVAKHYPWYYTTEEAQNNKEFSYYLRHSNSSCSYTRIGGGGVFKISDMKQVNVEYYNTDKFGMPGTFERHHYEGFYDELLYDKRNKYINVLEVGTWEGGAVRLLHDYLSNANIYGVDTNLLWSDTQYYPRLKMFSFDAYDLSKWNILHKMDIIIDDGPHSHESQIFALNNFPQFLNEGGILIVEDVPSYNLQRIMDSYTGSRERIKVYDWSWITGRFDDIIITYQ